jgi:hypothetical protein
LDSSIGEKIYLNRKEINNNENIKKKNLPPKPRKLNKSYNNSIQIFKLEKEKETLEKIRKYSKDSKNNIDNDLKLMKINLKKRLLNSLKKKKKNITLLQNKSSSIINSEKTKDLSSSSNSNHNTINNTVNNNHNINNNKVKFVNKKEKTVLKINLSSKILRSKPKLEYKKTLNELNQLTDRLGITNKIERENYINDKEKRILYENNMENNFKKGKKNKKFSFNSTSKLNNYIINVYNFNENPELIKKKIEIAQLSYDKIHKVKNKISYKKNKNFISSDSEQENSSYSLNYTKRNYSEKDMKKVKDEYYKFKASEKLKNNLKLFEKIKNLNYKNDNKFISNSYAEYKNLDKLIKLKRFKKKYLENDLTYKKEKLEEDQQKVYLALNKFQPSIVLQKRFKINTINQFKSINGFYFGLPV